MAGKSVRPLAPLILSDADALADAIAVLTRHGRFMRAIHTRTGASPRTFQDFAASL